MEFAVAGTTARSKTAPCNVRVASTHVLWSTWSCCELPRVKGVPASRRRTPMAIFMVPSTLSTLRFWPQAISCYDSLASNTTKGLPSGSILFGKNPTCQPRMDLLQFIVKQAPRQSGLYLNEPNVKTLLSDIKRMASFTRSTVPLQRQKNYYCPPIQIH